MSAEIEFKVPEVTIGQLVFWEDHASGSGKTPMIVTKLGNGGTISGNLVMDGYLNFRCVSGIHHKNDPVLKVKRQLVDRGVWEHTPQTAAIMSLLADLGTQMVPTTKPEAK